MDDGRRHFRPKSLVADESVQGQGPFLIPHARVKKLFLEGEGSDYLTGFGCSCQRFRD